MKIYPPQSSYNYLGKGDGKNSRCIPETGFPGGSEVKNPPANTGDVGSVPALGRSPGEGNGNPLQYSCWKIPWTEESGGLQSSGLQIVGID